MGYNITGESHSGGIDNEHSFVAMSNATNEIGLHYKSKYGVNVRIEHRGGTRTVDDAQIIVQTTGEKKAGISIKRHKAGTFDWLNTTHLYEKEVVTTQVGAFRERYRGISSEEFAEKEKELRAECAGFFDRHLDTITSEFLTSLLSTIYADYSDEVAIVDVTKGKTIAYSKENNFKEMVGYPDWTYYLKRGRGKNSAVIWRRRDGEDVSTSIRVRVVLNNGITALLGLSKSNKNSFICLKVQQENMRKYIDTREDVVIYKH
jgi:hypothetical protein